MVFIQTVYADMLFLVNFSMDMLCLILVSRLRSRRLTLPRAAAGASIGGIYSVAVLFINLPPPTAIPLHLICCILMCAAAFGIAGGFRTLLIDCASLLISSSLLGGVMTAAFSLLNSSGINTESAGENDLPPWLIISVGILSAVAARLGGDHLRGRASKKFADAEITLLGKTLTLHGFFDSGNLLADPISGRRVLVADEKYIEHFFDGRKKLGVSDLAEISPEAQRCAMPIPFHTPSGEKTIVAFRTQRLVIKYDGHLRESDALVGFARVEGVPDDCSVIIPTDLL